jgi:uncharacterized membrane protein
VGTRPGIVVGSRASAPRVWPGILVGMGLAGTLDEAVFHQLLDWHHFVERSDPGGVARALGLRADGAFHLVSTLLLAAGLAALLWRGGAALRGWGRRVAGGVLAGAGGFNLYDGLVQHKLLGLHQVRRGVESLLPYDLAWFAVAVALLVAGIALLRSPIPREGARA